MRRAGPRSGARRVLYLVGAIPSLLALLVSLRLALLLVHQERALSAYARGDFQTAGGEFDANRVLNPVQAWVAPFGEGTARYRQQDYAGAADALVVALSATPADKECAVRVNLALAHEGLGDAALEAGDRDEAEESWAEGIEALADCPRRDQDPVRTSAADVETRLLDKLGGRPDAPPEPSAEASPDDLEARKRQLEEQNERARERRRNSQEEPERPDSEIPQW